MLKRIILAGCLMAWPAHGQQPPAPPLEVQGLAIISWITNTTQELAMLRAKNAELTAENERMKAVKP